MTKEIYFKEETTMTKEIKDILKMKETVLEMTDEVYSKLCVLSKENKKIDVSFEKELVQNAAAALSNNADSREDCLKILTAYYLCVGIGLDSCGAPVNNLTESGLLNLREEAEV